MNRDPYRNNFDRQRELRCDEEAFLLRQEERRLEMARRNTSLSWIVNSIYLLIGLLEILLGLRFLLRVSGANAENSFAQLIYNLSAPFVAPFSTLFISPTSGDAANIFDVNVLIAMLVYAIAGWIVVSLLKFVQGR